MGTLSKQGIRVVLVLIAKVVHERLPLVQYKVLKPLHSCGDTPIQVVSHTSHPVLCLASLFLAGLQFIDLATCQMSKNGKSAAETASSTSQSPCGNQIQKWQQTIPHVAGK